METSKTLLELYEFQKAHDRPELAKHRVSTILLCVLEDLEQANIPITAETIDQALKRQLAVYLGVPEEKKVS